MTEKTYSQEALVELCRLEGTPKDAHTLEVADGCALVLHDDGVYFSLGDEFFNLSPPEQEALTGYPRLRPQETPHGRLYGLPGPLLPFPFTARQLWDFERTTAAVVECFWCGDETEEWIAEQAPDVQELARMLLADDPPQGASNASPKPELTDYRMLASRAQLIAAFGAFTGMSLDWFTNLKDAPALLAARRVRGQGGRRYLAEPYFCPFAVMQWLVNPQRRKGNSLREAKGWELLETHFPRVYASRSVGDPREPD